MKKVTITLEQQTPMLHFDKTPGATLRATEVKPKLDRYLIGHLFPENFQSFLVPNAEGCRALDYKIRIRGNTTEQPNDIQNLRSTPMFFGNTGTETIKYLADSKGSIYMDLIFCSEAFCTWLDNAEHCWDLAECLYQFFFLNNFGTRKTKGYGGFLVKQIKRSWAKGEIENYEPYVDDLADAVRENGDCDGFLHFPLEAQSFESAMKRVQWFYQSLRQGLNVYGRQGQLFYMKPMIFLYARSKGVQWEKKTVKENFLRAQLENEARRHNEDDSPVVFSSPDKRMVKTVFGMSSNEDWVKSNPRIRITISDNEADETRKFDRIPSPLTFKLFRREDTHSYDVYVIVKDNYQDIRNKQFMITESKSHETLPAPLSVIDNFSWSDFWDFVQKYNVEDAMTCHDSHGRDIYDTLVEIYKNLTIRI